ncbi:MAG: hypothetical protein ABGZ17_27125, partial [Planctomycetaceae bacterium]
EIEVEVMAANDVDRQPIQMTQSKARGRHTLLLRAEPNQVNEIKRRLQAAVFFAPHKSANRLTAPYCKCLIRRGDGFR